MVSNTLPGWAADAVDAFPSIFKLETGVDDITVNGAVPEETVELIIFAVTFPPTLMSCDTPIPPSVVIEPVDVFTDALVLTTFILSLLVEAYPSQL